MNHDDDLAGRLRDAFQADRGNDTDHDYARLAGGVSARAARLRRRRKMVTGAALVAITPAMAGAVFLGGRLLDNPGTGAPAGQPSDGVAQTASASPTGDVAEATTVIASDDGDQTADAAQSSSASPTGEAAEATSEATTATATDDGGTAEATTEGTAAASPPFQDPAPPEPENGMETGARDNRQAMPDPRPSGVDFLDALGVPKSGSWYPRTMPLMTFMAGNDLGHQGGAEPHSGAGWVYYDDSDTMGGPSIRIQLTAWDDAEAAMAGIRSDDGTVHAAFFLPFEPRSWPGHEGDDDYLMVIDEDTPTAGSLIRQGDYLIGVTVEAGSLDEAQQVASEIGEKSAANLAVLDPEHGTD